MSSNPSCESTPVTSHEASVIAQLAVEEKLATTKKKPGQAAKPKIETKNKEFTFKFERVEDNYLAFLSAILDKHGLRKYTPVVKERFYSFKIIWGKKKYIRIYYSLTSLSFYFTNSKKDALDVEKVSEYLEMVGRILDEHPSKILVYVDLEDIDKAHKRKISGERDHLGSSNEAETDDTSEDDEKGGGAIDRELACLRGLLEKKYQNPKDGGYTFVADDGNKVPLTPGMMSKWARAMYDGKATVDYPPNTLTFDPKTHARSLFHSAKASNSENNGVGVLTSISSILHDACVLFTGDATTSAPNPFKTPSQAPLPNNPPALSNSPAHYSPSKLSAFLLYAKEKLCIRDARKHESELELKGYGPDILSDVPDQDLINCSMNHGDAMHLKRGAEQWWKSPEAKRPHTETARSSSPPPAPVIRTCFVMKYCDGSGSTSVHGTGIEDGVNPMAHEFTWYYFNQLTQQEEKLPNGKVPILDPEYHDDPNIYPPSPSRFF